MRANDRGRAPSLLRAATDARRLRATESSDKSADRWDDILDDVERAAEAAMQDDRGSRAPTLPSPTPDSRPNGFHRDTHFDAQRAAPTYTWGVRPGDDDVWRPLIDPRLLVQAVMKSLWLIALCGILGAGAGVLLALSTPKQYYSQVELLVDPRELRISEREITPTGLPYDASLALVENQTQIITSRRVMEQVIDNLALDQDGEFNGEGSGGLMSPISLLRELLSGDGADNARSRREMAVQSLYQAVGVGRAPKSFVVYVGVSTEVPEKSAQIANEIARVYLSLQSELRSATAGRAGGELDQRLADLRSQVEQAERDVELFKTDNDIFDASGRRISEEEILRVSAQLTETRRQIIDLNSRAESARNRNATDVISGSLPEDAGSTILAELRSSYANQSQRVEALAQKLGPRHPDLLVASAELNAVAREIDNELRRISQTIQVDLQRAVRSEQELAAELARLKSQQGGLATELVQLRELEREAGAARAIYENFLIRARETREQGDINTANINIISEAVPALKPSSTSRKIIAIAGLMGGLMLGFGLALLRGAWWSLNANPPAPRRAKPPADNRRYSFPNDDDAARPSFRNDHRSPADALRVRAERAPETRTPEAAPSDAATVQRAPMPSPAPAPTAAPSPAQMPVHMPMPYGMPMTMPMPMMAPVFAPPMVQAVSPWMPQAYPAPSPHVGGYPTAPQMAPQTAPQPPTAAAAPVAETAASVTPARDNENGIRARLAAIRDSVAALEQTRRKTAALR